MGTIKQSACICVMPSCCRSIFQEVNARWARRRALRECQAKDRANTIQISPGKIGQRFLSLTKPRVPQEMSGLEKLESEFFWDKGYIANMLHDAGPCSLKSNCSPRFRSPFASASWPKRREDTIKISRYAACQPFANCSNIDSEQFFVEKIR